MLRLMVVISLAVSVLSGCASVISEESLRLVDRALTFKALRQNPDAYVGRYVLIGGDIAKVTNSNRGSQLEVIQFNLDSSGTPEDSYESGGRFLADTAAFLDPYVYKPGRMVTIVGEVRGKKTQRLDELEYVYPLVEVREIYLWKKEAYRDYYPPPGYYWYDPWWPYWFDPFWGPRHRW
jgi:outer membrane lipoprotein